MHIHEYSIVAHSNRVTAACCLKPGGATDEEVAFRLLLQLCSPGYSNCNLLRILLAWFDFGCYGMYIFFKSTVGNRIMDHRFWTQDSGE